MPKTAVTRFPRIKDYPKEIHLKDSTYKIVFVRGLKVIGLTDPEKCVIKIRKGMSLAETLKTVIHEVLHLVEFEWPVEIPHKIVYELEEALFSLFIDNFF